MLIRNQAVPKQDRCPRVVAIFGTRPEAIKMVPVIRELQKPEYQLDCRTLVTCQHTTLIDSLLDYFSVRADVRLDILRHGQSLDALMSRLLSALDPVLTEMAPDLVMVQGDTTTAVAGAMAAFHKKIPVMHIEAGLRSGSRYSPFPEEMNRRLITRLATYHMAATRGNEMTLREEGICETEIYTTGNTSVDALNHILDAGAPSAALEAQLQSLSGKKIIALTSHRRENFGSYMRTSMGILNDFVLRHDDVALVFPVHPNPAVRAECGRTFSACPRIKLIDHLLYPDFIHLLSRCWLIVSDSGGVQEEAPTLRKPLLVLRGNTERPEVLECGCARIVGPDPNALAQMLQDVYEHGDWARGLATISNPFGQGDAARKIVAAIVGLLPHSSLLEVKAS